MKIDDIKIFPCFSAHPPKQEKMESEEKYFRETGCLQSEIILDGAGNLIDRPADIRAICWQRPTG